MTVCPGTYTEKITIGAGKDNLKLVSEEPLQAVIEAPADGNIVHIMGGAKNVLLKGFTITGPLPYTLSCATPLSTGVRVDGNASASIENNHITEIRSTDAALRGCQGGIGIQVGRMADGAVGTALIKGNKIDWYQKNGITVDNAGSSATIENNEIIGTLDAVAAQNGIQISRGAAGVVRHNTVTGNDYTFGTTSATGILLYQAGNGIVVENNELSLNDVGIYLMDATAGAMIKNNKSHDNVKDGLYANASSAGSTFEGNKTWDNIEHDCHDDLHYGEHVEEQPGPDGQQSGHLQARQRRLARSTVGEAGA